MVFTREQKLRLRQIYQNYHQPTEPLDKKLSRLGVAKTVHNTIRRQGRLADVGGDELLDIQLQSAIALDKSVTEDEFVQHLEVLEISV